MHSVSCKEEDSASLLRLLLERFKDIMDEPDKNGMSYILLTSFENFNQMLVESKKVRTFGGLSVQ